MAPEEKTYFRFNYFHRLLHALVMVSFLGLALTGLPLKYSDAKWAVFLSHYLGGFETAGFVHRVSALITFGYFAIHFIYLFYFFKYKSKESLFKFLFGPDSLLPNLKDLKNISDNYKWFLGQGPKPKFDRWTYWEKFDYWAVFWGVTMIGGSGLILWFPTFFARFFPGWICNIAMIIHSEEALLATGFIFIFHFFHTHLRGEKFPLDSVIFTGRITKEEFIKERPLEYERLLQEGRLEEVETAPPPLWLRNFSRIVGFSALGVGLLIIILIIVTSL